MDKLERVDDMLEREMAARFNDTAEGVEPFQLERLAQHASMVASASRRSQISMRWLWGGAVAVVLATVIAVGFPTGEKNLGFDGTTVWVHKGDTTEAPAEDVGGRVGPSSASRGEELAGLDDDDHLAYNTYFDMGFDDDDLDLGFIHGAEDDMNEDQLIQVYDRVLQEGG